MICRLLCAVFSLGDVEKRDNTSAYQHRQPAICISLSLERAPCCTRFQSTKRSASRELEERDRHHPCGSRPPAYCCHSEGLQFVDISLLVEL